MVVVQPRCRYRSDKKLTTVGVLAGVRHADEQWPAVLHLEGFVVEVLAVNTDRTGAVAIFDISACNI